VYRVRGKMLVSHDKLPEWRPFTVELRALRPEHAVERVLSELGSRHKLKRYHVKIEEVLELQPGEAVSKAVKELASLQGFVAHGK